MAIDLIFAAIKSAKRGETYIPKVPSAKITDVVDVMIGDRKIEIQNTGIRPGEKTHEVLISEEECHRTIDRGDYFVIKPILPELRSSEKIDICLNKEYISADDLMNKDEIRELLRKNNLIIDD